MDREQKISIFCDSLGAGVDVGFAQSVLAAHDWDLQAALNAVLGDGGGAAPRPPRAEALDAEGYRAPMRTGYTDTLMAPITPAEERRQQLEREAEQRRLEEELLARAEAQRLAAERARHEQQARQIEEQRAEAERLALERRRQRQREAAVAAAAAAAAEAAAASGERGAPGPAPAAVSAAAPEGPGAGRPAGAWAPEAQAAPGPGAAEAARGPPEAERQRRDAEAGRQQAELERRTRKESEDLERERVEAEARQQDAGAAPPAKGTDAIVQALVALRKRYKDTDPAGLTTCLQTLRVYINNLARNPHDPKYQRINCDNNAFRSRVAAFEGATAVLIACGFGEEGGALAVGPDFVKTKGSRLWDALTKLDVMIDQLKGSS